MTPGLFFFSAASPSVLSPVFRLFTDARRTASTDRPRTTDRFRAGQALYSPHYAYRSAFHRVVPAVTCRPSAVFGGSYSPAAHLIGPASAELLFDNKLRTARNVITVGSQVCEERG